MYEFMHVCVCVCVCVCLYVCISLCMQVKIDKITKLKPAFKPADGTVTAANSSSINDGAAALVVMSAGKTITLVSYYTCAYM